MKCIKCGNETQNPDAVCDSCRKAEDVFRRRVRMESEEHVKQVRMEEAYHQTITWKEKMGLNSKQGKLLVAALTISAIAFIISLFLSFILSLLLGHSLSNLMAVNYVNGENYINGFAMLKMAYLNNLKLSVQFSSVGITGEATATGSISILILVLIPFLAFKLAWMIFSKWIYKTQIGERATVGIIVCILIVYTFGFALTSFIPVLWLKEESSGLKLDARMYFTLASSIIGTFFVVLAANILAVRKKNRIKEERKNTAAYIDLKAFFHIAAVYIILSFVITIVGIILFLSSQAKDWTSFDKRTVLHFHPAIAPVKVGVLPLSKKLNEGAEKVFADLSKYYNCEFDDRGNIGKRYRRQDEIGTPFCVTYDFDSETDGAVTVRDRDTMEQERVKIEDLKAYLDKKMEF